HIVVANNTLARPWLPFELWAELRAMPRMYFDPRYRMTRLGRWLPLALLVAIATSWFWVPGAGILPGTIAAILVKIVDLVLAYFMIKIVIRETDRYRATVSNTPSHAP